MGDYGFLEQPDTPTAEQEEVAGEVACRLLGNHVISDFSHYPLVCDRCKQALSQGMGGAGTFGGYHSSSIASYAYGTVVPSTYANASYATYAPTPRKGK